MSSEFTKFTTYTRRFFSGTLLSRFSGMFRDIAMAFAFGDHPLVASFMVAFRFSQFFRRIFGEGSLQATFIPHYENLRLESEKKASLFYKELLLYLFFLLSLLCLVSILVLKTGSSLIQGYAEIFTLTAWMMPSLIFVCLYALNAAALQCHGSFFLSGAAPIVCNLTWIAAALLLKKTDMDQAMPFFSCFVVLGFFLQWIATLPLLFKKLKLSAKEWLSIRFHFPKEEIQGLSKAFSLATLGVGATQINSTLDALFAHASHAKGPIYLWYAIRLEQLPLALFGIAFVSAITPTLTRRIKEQKIEEAAELFSKAKKRLSALMLACSFALFSLAIPGITLLFKHGKFSQEAIFATANCLYAYGIGLYPATQVLLYSSLFYAFNDYKTPTKASLLSIACNVLLNALFVFGFSLQETSVAFATSVSSFANLFLLKKALSRYNFPLKEKKSLRKETLKTLAAGLCALIATHLIEKTFLGSSLFAENSACLPDTLWKQALYLGLMSLCFVGSFFSLCYFFRCQTIFSFVKELFAFGKRPQETKELL